MVPVIGPRSSRVAIGARDAISCVGLGGVGADAERFASERRATRTPGDTPIVDGSSKIYAAQVRIPTSSRIRMRDVGWHPTCSALHWPCAQTIV